MSCPVKVDSIDSVIPSSFGLGYNGRGYGGRPGGYGGGMGGGMGGGKVISIFIILLGLIAYTSYTIYMINKDDQGELEEKNVSILAAACAIVFTLIFSYTIDKPLSLGLLAVGIIAYSAYTIDMVKKDQVGDLKTTTIWMLSISCVIVAGIAVLVGMNPSLLRY